MKILILNEGTEFDEYLIKRLEDRQEKDHFLIVDTSDVVKTLNLAYAEGYRVFVGFSKCQSFINSIDWFKNHDVKGVSCISSVTIDRPHPNLFRLSPPNHRVYRRCKEYVRGRSAIVIYEKEVSSIDMADHLDFAEKRLIDDVGEIDQEVIILALTTRRKDYRFVSKDHVDVMYPFRDDRCINLSLIAPERVIDLMVDFLIKGISPDFNDDGDIV